MTCVQRPRGACCQQHKEESVGGSAKRGEPEQRWVQALAILDGSRDPRTQRRSRNWRLVVLLAALVLLTAATAAVGYLLSTHNHGPAARHHRPPDVSQVRKVGALVVILVGLVVEMVGLVRLVRSKHRKAVWRLPTLALTSRQRRQLMRQVRGRAPMQPARLRLLRDLAERMQGQYQGPFGPYGLLFGGLSLLWAGQAVGSTRVWVQWLSLPLMGLYPFVMTLMRRDARQAAGFLTQYPEPSPAS